MNAVADYDTPLPLDLDEEDTPLYSATVDVLALRRALADTLAHLAANTTPPADRWRTYTALAGIPGPDAGLTPAQARDEGIARASAKWTDDEVAAVDKAIFVVATTRRRRWEALPAHHPRGKALEFTTADVWAQLGEGFTVTKGIAGRMIAAKNAGMIRNTGRTIIAPTDATGPNHGQRLTVWAAT